MQTASTEQENIFQEAVRLPNEALKAYLTSERIKQLKEELECHGVAVVPGVLTIDQCDEAISQLHQWFKKFGENGFPKTFSSLLNTYNIGNHSVCWLARLQSVPVWEAVWGTEKLLCSTDGMALGQPPEDGREHFNSGKRMDLRLHVDQGPDKLGLHGYQGAVYFEETLEDDWCFVVIDKSHRFHEEFHERRDQPPVPAEQVVLSEAEIDWFLSKGCTIRKIPVPKGGMVLWDSRTIHSGVRPEKNRQNPGRWRYVSFVCMAPAVWASTEEKEIKKKAYRDMRTTRHWPGQHFEAFRVKEVPQELNTVNALPEIAMTEKARFLMGDLEYSDDDGKPNGPPKPRVKIYN